MSHSCHVTVDHAHLFLTNSQAYKTDTLNGLASQQPVVLAGSIRHNVFQAGEVKGQH